MVKPSKEYQSFNQDYPDSFKEIVSSHPKPLGANLKTSVRFDANNTHDQIIRRFISGLIFYVGKTSISARPSVIYPSTYSVWTLWWETSSRKSNWFLFRSLNVSDDGPTILYSDNDRMLQASSFKDNTLKKKTVPYHTTSRKKMW